MVARRSRSSRCCWLTEAEVSRTVLRAALRAAGRSPADSKRRPGRPLTVRVPSRGRAGRSGRCGVRVSAERWADAAGMCCTSIGGRAFSRAESFGRPGSGGQVLQDQLEFRPRGDGWGRAEEVSVAALSARREVRSKVWGRADGDAVDNLGGSPPAVQSAKNPSGIQGGLWRSGFLPKFVSVREVCSEQGLERRVEHRGRGSGARLSCGIPKGAETSRSRVGGGVVRQYSQGRTDRGPDRLERG